MREPSVCRLGSFRWKVYCPSWNRDPRGRNGDVQFAAMFAGSGSDGGSAVDVWKAGMC
jgi:hypothetical protein